MDPHRMAFVEFYSNVPVGPGFLGHLPPTKCGDCAPAVGWSWWGTAFPDRADARGAWDDLLGSERDQQRPPRLQRKYHTAREIQHEKDVVDRFEQRVQAAWDDAWARFTCDECKECHEKHACDRALYLTIGAQERIGKNIGAQKQDSHGHPIDPDKVYWDIYIKVTRRIECVHGDPADAHDKDWDGWEIDQAAYDRARHEHPPQQEIPPFGDPEVEPGVQYIGTRHD